MEPVLQPRFVLDSWKQQPVHYVLTNGGQDGQTKPDAQQHEESREVFDAHLQSLGQNRKGKAMNVMLPLAPSSVLDGETFPLDPRRAGDHPCVLGSLHYTTRCERNPARAEDLGTPSGSSTHAVLLYEWSLHLEGPTISTERLRDRAGETKN